MTTGIGDWLATLVVVVGGTVARDEEDVGGRVGTGVALEEDEADNKSDMSMTGGS